MKWLKFTAACSQTLDIGTYAIFTRALDCSPVDGMLQLSNPVMLLQGPSASGLGPAMDVGYAVSRQMDLSCRSRAQHANVGRPGEPLAL